MGLSSLTRGAEENKQTGTATPTSTTADPARTSPRGMRTRSEDGPDAFEALFHARVTRRGQSQAIRIELAAKMEDLRFLTCLFLERFQGSKSHP